VSTKSGAGAFAFGPRFRRSSSGGWGFPAHEGITQRGTNTSKEVRRDSFSYRAGSKSVSSLEHRRGLLGPIRPGRKCLVRSSRRFPPRWPLPPATPALFPCVCARDASWPAPMMPWRSCSAGPQERENRHRPIDDHADFPDIALARPRLNAGDEIIVTSHGSRGQCLPLARVGGGARSDGRWLPINRDAGVLNRRIYVRCLSNKTRLLALNYPAI